MHDTHTCMCVFVCVFVSRYVCVSMCVCVWFCLCMCIRIRLYVCIYMYYVCIHVCVCIHICVSVCTRVGTPVCICYYLISSVYTHPLFLYVFSCYPILHVIKRRSVTQLRLPPAACQGYLSSLRVLSAVSGRQFGPSLFLLFSSLFTSLRILVAPIILAVTSPGGFVFSSVLRILPSLFHCCPPDAETYVVLPAFYTVVLWRRDNRPSHASYLCSFAGILHRCNLAPVNRPLHASRESGVAYLIGEVNCRCFSCMQRVIVGVCFPTLFSTSMASLFRRMLLGVFFLCLHVVLSHVKI